MRSRSPLLARPGDITIFPSSYMRPAAVFSAVQQGRGVGCRRRFCDGSGSAGTGRRISLCIDQGECARPSRAAAFGGAQRREVFGRGGVRSCRPAWPPARSFRGRPKAPPARAPPRWRPSKLFPRGGDVRQRCLPNVCRADGDCRCCHPVPGGSQDPPPLSSSAASKALSASVLPSAPGSVVPGTRWFLDRLILAVPESAGVAGLPPEQAPSVSAAAQARAAISFEQIMFITSVHV